MGTVEPPAVDSSWGFLHELEFDLNSKSYIFFSLLCTVDKILLVTVEQAS